MRQKLLSVRVVIVRASRMLDKKDKRASATPPKHKVKKPRVHVIVPELTKVTYSELDEMQIDVHQRKDRAKDFKLVQMYVFMYNSSRWKKINYEHTDEFLNNYDIKKGAAW